MLLINNLFTNAAGGECLTSESKIKHFKNVNSYKKKLLMQQTGYVFIFTLSRRSSCNKEEDRKLSPSTAIRHVYLINSKRFGLWGKTECQKRKQLQLMRPFHHNQNRKKCLSSFSPPSDDNSRDFQQHQETSSVTQTEFDKLL